VPPCDFNGRFYYIVQNFDHNLSFVIGGLNVIRDLDTDAYAMAPAQQGAGQAGDCSHDYESCPAGPYICHLLFPFDSPPAEEGKEIKKMLDELKKGDKVVTAGGIYGVIESVETGTVTVKIAENVGSKSTEIR